MKDNDDNRQFLKPTSTSPVDNSDETLLRVFHIAWQMIKLKRRKIDRGENTDNLQGRIRGRVQGVRIPPLR